MSTVIAQITSNLQSKIYPLTVKVKVDLTNKVFTSLTAIRPIGRIFIKENTKVSRVVWECKCICGNTHLATASSLLKNKCQRCTECASKSRKSRKNIMKYHASRKELGTTEYSFRRLYSRYKNGAVTRNKEFALSYEEFELITKSNCHYCGTPPNKVANFYSYIKKDGKPYYTYNGIDRKDNDLGYTLENSLPCCSKCNMLKVNTKYDEFIALIKAIAKNLEVR